MKATYISHMGDDLSIVNAARVSFDKESGWIQRRYAKDDAIDESGNPLFADDVELPHEYEEWGDYSRAFDYDGCELTGKMLPAVDARLISYLARNGHWTPFAHTAISLRMSAPVPIARQAFKHKQGFVENEESRRYISSEPELFVPDEFRTKADKAKQGSGGAHPRSGHWRTQYNIACGMAIDLYLKMIEDGVCPEQARFVLPQGALVNWVWTGSLAAYARFYNQRTDPHAQQEIQTMATAAGEIIAPLFPVAWAALTAKAAA